MPLGSRPTRADMNRGIFPEGTPPTLAKIKQGARLAHKPYTLEETYLMKRYRTGDLRLARTLEKEDKKAKREKISELL